MSGDPAFQNDAFQGDAFQAGIIDLAGGAIASAEAFGTAKLNLTIFPSAIGSAEAFGTAYLFQPLSPTGIASAEAFGIPQLNLTIFPTALATAEAFGTLKVNRYLVPSGIASLEAFGSPTVIVIRFGGHRMALVILDRNDVPIGQPFTNIFGASLTDALDNLSSFVIQIPAQDIIKEDTFQDDAFQTDAFQQEADILTSGRTVVIYREGEGPIFKGKIGRKTWEIVR